jgi:hypothetical protein
MRDVIDIDGLPAIVLKFLSAHQQRISLGNYAVFSLAPLRTPPTARKPGGERSIMTPAIDARLSTGNNFG